MGARIPLALLFVGILSFHDQNFLAGAIIIAFDLMLWLVFILSYSGEKRRIQTRKKVLELASNYDKALDDYNNLLLHSKKMRATIDKMQVQYEELRNLNSLPDESKLSIKTLISDEFRAESKRSFINDIGLMILGTVLGIIASKIF